MSAVDPALAVHDLIDLARQHADASGDTVLGDAQSLEVLAHPDLPRVATGSMVVRLGGLVRASCHPSEDLVESIGAVEEPAVDHRGSSVSQTGGQGVGH